MLSGHVDFETCSDLDLNEVGVYRYVEHPSTRILCMSYALPGQDVRTWFPGMRLNEDLMWWARSGEMLSAWNDGFERTVWNTLGVRHGFPPTTQAQWHNVQAIAMQRNLPASLDGTAAALGTEEQKDAIGKKLMQKMARGKDITPANLQRLGTYCAQDVRTEASADVKLGQGWQWREREVYLMSERINDRGIKIDLEFVHIAAQAVTEYQEHVARDMQRRFGIAPTQVQKIREACARQRIELPDLRADTVDEVIDAAEFYPPDVVEMLKLRQLAAAVSPKKYHAMLRAVCSDGRIRGMFSYYGAMQTGRWSARIVQPHNLPRPTMPYEEVRRYMEMLRKQRTWKCLGDDPLNVLLNCIRPSLISDTGFTSGDESQIEARVLPWLSGDQNTLDIFRRGEDVYEHTATDIPGADRQIGKVATLSLGYQGGKDAFRTMGRNYGVTVQPDRAEEIKVAWREAHPEIVAFWWALQDAAIAATTQHGRSFNAGEHITFKHTGTALWMRLPSGRALCYPGMHLRLAYPKWEMDKPEELRIARPTLCYWVPAGANMVREYTYGGKLAENATQASSRDVLAEALLEVQDLPLVLHVHDEGVAEGDHRSRLAAALTRQPTWARGLPLAAAVKPLERYWKA